MIASSISAPLNLAAVDQCLKSKLLGFAAALARWMRKISARSSSAGQVHEEDFVQPSFAQQFGRQVRNVVGGGDDEHRGALLRKPGQKRAEHPRRRAAIGHRRSSASRRTPCRFRPPTESRARRIPPPRWPAAHFLRTNPPGCRTSGPCRSAAAAIARGAKPPWRKDSCRSPARPAAECPSAPANRTRAPRP